MSDVEKAKKKKTKEDTFLSKFRKGIFGLLAKKVWEREEAEMNKWLAE